MKAPLATVAALVVCWSVQAAAQPSPPRLRYPDSGSTTLRGRTGFSWWECGRANGDVRYALEVDDDIGFRSPEVRLADLATTGVSAVDAGALRIGERHYWRVEATDQDGATWSAVRSFTIAERERRYVVEVTEAGQGFDGQVHHRSRAAPGTSYTLPDWAELSEGVGYEWRVAALDEAGNAQRAGPFAMSLGHDHPPPPPGLRYPAPNEDVINARPTFVWEEVSDPTGAVTYALQISDSASFADPMVEVAGLEDPWGRPDQDLPAAQRLYWRVVASDPPGNSVGTPARRFRVLPRQVEYDWELVPAGGDFASPLQHADRLVEAAYEVPDDEPLAEGQVYQWRVLAADQAGNETACNAPLAFLLGDVFPPSPPLLMQPADRDKLLNPRPTFVWSASTDPNGATYRIQVDDDRSFNSPEVDQGGLETPYHRPADTLAFGTLYYWRIEARDSRGNEHVTPSASFRVVAKEPLYSLIVSHDAALVPPIVRQDRIRGSSYELRDDQELPEAGEYFWQVLATDPAGNSASAESVFRFTLEDNFPPAAPRLLYPGSREQVLDPRLTLVWSAVTDPSGVTYGVQVDDERTFDTPAVDVSGFEDAHHAVAAGALEPGTRYWWRVSVTDGRGNSQATVADRFTLAPRVPYYELQVSRDDGFLPPLAVSQDRIEGAEYTLAGGYQALEDVGVYFWRVIAKDRAGNEQPSGVFRMELEDRFAPAPPVLLYPGRREQVLNPRTAFSWAAAVDPSGVSYTLQVDDDPRFDDPDVERGGLESTHYVAPIGGLDFGVSYFWRIIATDGQGNAVTSEVLPFTVVPKTPLYELQVSRRDDFAPLFLSQQRIETTEYTLEEERQELEEGGEYWWRVLARDRAGNEAASASAFHLELEDIYPPGVPTLVRPLVNDRVLNPRVTFVWKAAGDPGGATYGVQVDDDPLFETPELDQAGIETLYFTAPAGALPQGGRYWWRVSATDGVGNSITSEAQRFAVDAHGVTYALVVSRDDSFEQPAVSAGGIPVPLYELLDHQALEETGRYFWTVVAEDAAGSVTEADSVFVMQLEDRFPPPAPRLLYPGLHEVVLNPATALLWTAVEDPSGVVYRVQVDDDAGFGSPEVDADDLETAHHAAPAGVLALGSLYHWRVQARDTLGHGVWSDPSDFRVFDDRVQYELSIARDQDDFDGTLVRMVSRIEEAEYTLAQEEELPDIGDFWWRVAAADPAGNETPSDSTFRMHLEDVYPPPPPELVYPPDRDWLLNRQTTFVWTEVSDPTPPVTYTLEVDDQRSFASLDVEIDGLREPYYRLVAGEFLEPETVYFWRVRATDGDGLSSVSEVRWVRVVAKDCDYVVSLSRFESLDPVLWSTVPVPDPEYETPEERALEEGGQYYWRVVARDLAGLETVSTPAHFAFDLEDIYPPPAPVPIFPVAGEGVLDPQVPFSWAVAFDPSGVTYQVQVDDAADFATPVHEAQGLALRSNRFAQALSPETPMWWRVLALDGAGNSSGWTEPIPFEVARLDPVYRLEIAPDDDFGLATCQVCDNGAVEECGLAVGLCVPGLRECVLGKWSECRGTVLPVPEFCDGKDNDCDGEVDEDSLCSAGCNDGDLRPCGTDEGVCVAGIQRCSGNAWRQCVDVTVPEAERCDGEDNDCDGETDEEVCEDCQVDARARRVVPILDTEFELPPDELLDVDVEYKWRVIAIDRAGVERPANQVFRFTPSEGGMVIAGGVKVTYFDGIAFDQERLWRVEPTIDQPAVSDDNPFGDFDTGIGVDTFSVRWEGWVKADFNETYTFYATSDDGQRLWINGQLVIDDWEIHEATERRAAVALTEGWHYLKYEVFENMGTARATIEYSSRSTERQVIPSDHLGVASDPDDDEPPILEDMWVGAVTPDAAVFVYASDEPVRALVEYGPTSDYGSRTMGRVSDKVRISGLQPGRTYHYRLTLMDPAGNEAPAPDRVLCTPAISDVVGGRLQAEFHRGLELDDLVVARRENGIDQPALSDDNLAGDFGTGAGPDNFSALWAGIVRVDRAGEYVWHATSDDGQRLYIDLERQINDWRAHLQTTRHVVQTLDASWHTIRYEWYDAVGDAFARLEWEGHGLDRQVVPPASLGYVKDEFYEPRLTARDEAVGTECASPTGAELELLPIEAYDCRDPEPVVVHNAPEVFPLGETRVVWQATNRWGQSGHLAEFVNVADSTPPELTPPDDVLVEATSPLGTPVDLPEPEVEDTCDVEPEISYHLCLDGRGRPCQACWREEDLGDGVGRVLGERNPSCGCEDAPLRFGLDPTVVTVMATDAAGNCASAGFEVAVQDTTPPFIEPGQVEFVCRTAPIPLVVARDNATPEDRIRMTCRVDTDDEPGSCDRDMELELGPHFVDYTAIDLAENVRTVRLEFEVTNEDPHPPVLELVAMPEGWTNGRADVEVRVSDNCDPDPDVVFVPDATEVTEDGAVHTAAYSVEGVYLVDVSATDEGGSEGTLSDLIFGIDLTSPTATFSGLDEVAAPEDRLSWPAFFESQTIDFRIGARDQAGDAQSGLASVTAVLEHLDTGASRVVHSSEYGVDFDEPPAGPERVKNLPCEDLVPGGETTWCDGEGDLLVGALEGGDYHLLVTARDQAGNEVSLDRWFTVMDWRTAVTRTADLAGVILAAGTSSLVGLMLAQVRDEREAAGFAVERPELLGNALLYTYTFINALEFTETQDGDDTAAPRLWLNRGAYAAMLQFQEEVEDEVGEDDPDVLQADLYMDEARDYLEAEPPSHLASVLALENAYFYFRHALDPFIITDDVDAQTASQRVQRLLQDYLGIEGANGVAEVAAIEAIQREIEDGEDFTTIVNRLAMPTRQVNRTFIGLLRRLNQMAGLMSEAQDVWVWTRNWQWPISLQIRELAFIGLEAAAHELGDDIDAPVDPVLAEARATYDEGVEFIDDRLVDEALDVYIDARCLIYEVYNHALFDPHATPPAEWDCPACVSDGECPH